MRRVVITGAGTVNALGGDVPATLAAMRAGRGAIGAIDLPDLDRLSIRIGAQVPGLPELRFKSAIALHGRYILGTDGSQHVVSTDGEQWTTRAP